MKPSATMALMDLYLRQLRYFVTVAEELSFVRAAALLHMTQPALNRQVSALEHDLGTLLFDRDRRGTSRTVALVYNKHRSMPELDEFAELATSMLGNGSKNEQRP
jgi:DNA-binding transcriptional LysR family regulator